MTDSLVARARAVLETERQALDTALDRAPEQVAAAARLILDREPADVIVTGVGKSGHIAHKLAATFSSVGTRSHFYWTSEMFHGDLGSVDQAGVVIVVSKSGSGADIAQLVDFCHHRGIGLIGIIADTHSPIVSKLDVLIDASIHQEADPEGFVPTTSTTLALALGDALAVCLMEARGFTSTDFAKFHPNGALGARLNRTVAEIMAGPDDIPRLQPDHSVRDLAIEMSRHPTGLAVVHGDDEALLGVVSDGDLRRALTEVSDLSDTQVREVMTTDPSTIEPDALLAHALAVMEGHQPGAISALPVVSAGKVLGVVTIHQLHREIPS
ncbi:MAG: Arabinose 5-phosphate isomerase KdsD [Cellulomonadaceae bacterium TMED98]|nr:MAG: Arabinose 5-phosphate isomerase KdsD [Cellulomonadaceae bacterium TMED98]